MNIGDTVIIKDSGMEGIIEGEAYMNGQMYYVDYQIDENHRIHKYFYEHELQLKS